MASCRPLKRAGTLKRVRISKARRLEPSLPFPSVMMTAQRPGLVANRRPPEASANEGRLVMGNRWSGSAGVRKRGIEPVPRIG